MFFIKENEVPRDRRRDITYARIVCNYRDQKKVKHPTLITMGGDGTNCPFDCGTTTADILTIKLLLNSVIFIPGGKTMTVDISNFYLNTPMSRYEYIRMKLEMFPDDVIAEYNLREKVEPDGYVYIEVHKGMYGLLQAGITCSGAPCQAPS